MSRKSDTQAVKAVGSIAGDLGRQWLLDVCANGSVSIRRRGAPARGVLPVFSTDTEDQAKSLRVRHCKLARDGSGMYHLNERPAGIEDLPRITAMFRETFRLTQEVNAELRRLLPD